MKGFVKNLGLLLIVLGAVVLLICSFTGYVNNNTVLGGAMTAMVVGLISYIIINKRIVD